MKNVPGTFVPTCDHRPGRLFNTTPPPPPPLRAQGTGLGSRRCTLVLTCHNWSTGRWERWWGRTRPQQPDFPTEPSASAHAHCSACFLQDPWWELGWPAGEAVLHRRSHGSRGLRLLQREWHICHHFSGEVEHSWAENLKPERSPSPNFEYWHAAIPKLLYTMWNVHTPKLCKITFCLCMKWVWNSHECHDWAWVFSLG